MIDKKYIIILGVLLLLPVVVLANPPMPARGGITDIGVVIGNIIDVIWKIFVGGAVIAFIFAGFEFLTAQGEASKLTLARNAVIYGIVGIIVAILGFSMVMFIQSTITPEPERVQVCDLQCQDGMVCSLVGGIHCEAAPQQGIPCNENGDCPEGRICLQSNTCSLN